MVENIKTLTDDEVINLINQIVTDNENVELSDLKVILAEASARKLEKKYINIIAERIKIKIQPEPVENRRKPEPELKKEPEEKKEQSKPTFDDVYMQEEDEYEEYEKYPAISFLSGLYAVFAWIFLFGFIIVAGVNSVLIFRNNVYIICGLIFAGIILGLVSFILFYSKSEKLKLMMDIERHLHNISKNSEK